MFQTSSSRSISRCAAVAELTHLALARRPGPCGVTSALAPSASELGEVAPRASWPVVEVGVALVSTALALETDLGLERGQVAVTSIPRRREVIM